MWIDGYMYHGSIIDLKYRDHTIAWQKSKIITASALELKCLIRILSVYGMYNFKEYQTEISWKTTNTLLHTPEINPNSCFILHFSQFPCQHVSFEIKSWVMLDNDEKFFIDFFNCLDISIVFGYDNCLSMNLPSV